MKSSKTFEAWFVTGSQDLYGEQTLRQVAEDSQRIVRGLSESPRIPVKVVYNTDQLHKLVAEKVQSQWQDHLGVTVELENREWKVFLKELTVSPPPVFRLGWGAQIARGVGGWFALAIDGFELLLVECEEDVVDRPHHDARLLGRLVRHRH